jgi:large subunit ribosomal protein L11
LIKRAANLAKASGTSGKEIIGKITRKQVEEIAHLKMEDLNTSNMAQAMKVIEGTCRSMGIAVEG